ncbi:MAG: hypothetical protein Q4A62_00830 [Eikenella sp.]|nr:hypothetical protein [Eikenella sp.]
MNPARLAACAALCAAALNAAAAPLTKLPAGLYRESGATVTTFSGGEPMQPLVSEGNLVREVCVPADSGAWYAEQLRRFPQAVTPQMREQGVNRIEVRSRVGTDSAGRPEVWIGYTQVSRNPNLGGISRLHSHLLFSYLGKPCPIDASAAAD